MLPATTLGLSPSRRLFGSAVPLRAIAVEVLGLHGRSRPLRPFGQARRPRFLGRRRVVCKAVAMDLNGLQDG